MTRPLTELKRAPVEDVLGGLLNKDSEQASIDRAQRIMAEAKEYGLNLTDYLTIKIDTHAGDFAKKYDGKIDLNGFETALAYLNLPFRNDFKQGVLLQAAADTFQTYAGTRAMFPPVIDAMLKFANRQNVIERVDPFLANSRTITGTELVSTVVDDDSADRKSYTVSEGGRIPVRSIRTSENSVKIWKHGSGYEFSYEFARRASLDIVTPFANRVNRELELSKVTAALSVLVNGDGVHAASPVTKQVADWSGAASTGLEYKPLLRWLNSRAKAGVPVDVVVGNYEALVEWLFLFMPTVAGNRSEAAAMAAEGAPALKGLSVPGYFAPVGFAVAGGMTAGSLLGLTKDETLEELVEAGSQISESEQAIRNQVVTYVKTESTGYKLAFGDTRSTYDWTN